MASSEEEKWHQRPLQVGVISGITTGVIVGIFLIIISGWMLENVAPSIILLNHTSKNLNSNIPNSKPMQNIDVNLLVSNPSSKSIIIQDVIINVQVNGSWLPKPRDIWLPRTAGGVFYETIVRSGDQIILSTRGNDFWMVPPGEHKVRVTVIYHDGKSIKSLYGYFNLSIDEFGTPYEHYQKGEEYNKIKLTDKSEYLNIAEY